MKKAYIQPAIETVNVEVEEIIATSMKISNTTTTEQLAPTERNNGINWGEE